MRERTHRRENVVRRHRRPRPEQRTEHQRDRRRRQQRQHGAQQDTQAPVRLQRGRREHADAEVEHREHRADAQAEGTAERHAQPRQHAPRRRGQGVEHAHAEVQRPQHGGGEGNVLGVGEHRPRPRPGNQQQHERRQPRPLAAKPACEQPGAGQPGKAEEGREQVAQVPQRGPFSHAGALEGGRDEVEEAAVQIKVLVLEGLAIGESGGVEVEQQAAVDMLDLLVVADAVLVEGEQRERPGQHQHGERQPAGERPMRLGGCRRGRRARRRARRDHRSRSGLRSKPSRSDTRNSGRPLTSVKMRPTYSPSTPRLINWMPDRNKPDTISDT